MGPIRVREPTGIPRERPKPAKTFPSFRMIKACMIHQRTHANGELANRARFIRTPPRESAHRSGSADLVLHDPSSQARKLMASCRGTLGFDLGPAGTNQRPPE